MILSDFSYHLPPELIAQEGSAKRDGSRLLVLHPDDRRENLSFDKLAKFLKKGDLLVLNNSRVVQAKLIGKKESGGKIDCLLIPRSHSHGPALNMSTKIHEAFLRGSNIRPGVNMVFSNPKKPGNDKVLHAKVIGKGEGARFTIEFDDPSLLDSFAELPLPPYIKKPLEIQERYQNVYSKTDGSLASPTAGLHFTDAMIKKLQKKGVEFAYVTLHIGTSTFSPIRTEDYWNWKLDPEYYRISEETAAAINKAIKSKRRIIAVGTTSVRTLESSFVDGAVQAGENWTDIFIYPGYEFKFPYAALLTNFHLPKSSLLLLVCAFRGKEAMLTAYVEAVAEKYRFYSLGDSMFIPRKGF